MISRSPEEEARELQERLNAELGSFAPRLGPPPARVKMNAVWVWIGAAVFGAPGAVINDDGARAMTAGLAMATIVCLVVAFGYERLYWRAVERARDDHCARRSPL